MSNMNLLVQKPQEGGRVPSVKVKPVETFNIFREVSTSVSGRWSIEGEWTESDESVDGSCYSDKGRRTFREWYHRLDNQKENKIKTDTIIHISTNPNKIKRPLKKNSKTLTKEIKKTEIITKWRTEVSTPKDGGRVKSNLLTDLSECLETLYEMNDSKKNLLLVNHIKKTKVKLLRHNNIKFTQMIFFVFRPKE